ncbi:hypothetical protein DM02DRAFT_615878 [Periconia macrospinosa]|uniref:Uncharacterized protein n=1 Tax=Periconia macrospinosa TaxID=97972 RepID=A0A2V1DJL4_9PLEO|nr:hypothetical protein DM02DRAFT_615878 [Periconia macrospinosa]
MKRWEWFTFCFIPIIPFSLKPYREVGCHICNFWQDIKYRPDVQAMINGGGGQQQQGYAMSGGEHGAPGGGGQQKYGYNNGGPPPPQGYGPPPAGVPGHQQYS